LSTADVVKDVAREFLERIELVDRNSRLAKNASKRAKRNFAVPGNDYRTHPVTR
jgi:hypothetical protein